MRVRRSGAICEDHSRRCKIVDAESMFAAQITIAAAEDESRQT